MVLLSFKLLINFNNMLFIGPGFSQSNLRDIPIAVCSYSLLVDFHNITFFLKLYIAFLVVWVCWSFLFVSTYLLLNIFFFCSGIFHFMNVWQFICPTIDRHLCCFYLWLLSIKKLWMLLYMFIGKPNSFRCVASDENDTW